MWEVVVSDVGGGGREDAYFDWSVWGDWDSEGCGNGPECSTLVELRGLTGDTRVVVCRRDECHRQ